MEKCYYEWETKKKSRYTRDQRHQEQINTMKFRNIQWEKKASQPDTKHEEREPQQQIPVHGSSIKG